MFSDRVDTRLADILANISAIETYTSGLNVTQFAAQRIVVDACERYLQRITEAVIKIGAERMAEIAPDVPFHVIRGMGNTLRHAYDDIDGAVVYDTIVHELPKLKARCERALDI
jgi:uncharacterized protein with HEPN domain